MGPLAAVVAPLWELEDEGKSEEAEDAEQKWKEVVLG